MNIDIQGLKDLVLTILNAIANFDMKTLSFDSLAELLTKYSAIWNPIWVAVTKVLERFIDF